MAVFASRPTGYKAGAFILLFAYILFIVGFTSPYWATAGYEIYISNNRGSSDYRYSHHDYPSYETRESSAAFTASGVLHEGLWMVCKPLKKVNYISVNNFVAFDVSDFATWFHVVRFLECVCTIGLTATCFYVTYINFYRSRGGPLPRIVEMTTGVAGLLGFIGCMVYMDKVKHTLDEEQDEIVLGDNITLDLNDYTVSWSFYLSAIGSGLSFIAAVVIAVCNKPLNYKPLDTPRENGQSPPPDEQPPPYPGA